MRGKKILITMVLILIGMAMILLGWLGRSSYESQVQLESCRVVCPDKCQPIPQSIITPFMVFFKYYWIFMMVGTILIGLAIGRLIG